MYVRGYLQGSENGRVVTIVTQLDPITGIVFNITASLYIRKIIMESHKLLFGMRNG